MRDISIARAVAAYSAMQRSLYLPDGRGLYRETAAPGSAPAYVWSFSRALLGTLCLAATGAVDRAAVQDRLRGLEQYWFGTAYASAVMPPGGDVYYDDNAWIGLALILAYRLGLTASLDRPKQLFELARRGWDRRRGGVYWVQQDIGYGLSNHDRGAGATAGSAEIGLHLHELGHSSTYDHACRMIDWVAHHLDASRAGAGPFLNVVRPDDSIDTNIWSYNQGVMIGALTLQYRISCDPRSLQTAEAIAHQTLATFGDFTNHPPSFNAMCFQNLLMLHALSTDSALKEAIIGAMHRYGDWAWTTARDPEDLFYFDDAGRPAVGRQPARVQDQGALTQLYALLAWDAQGYGKLT